MGNKLNRHTIFVVQKGQRSVLPQIQLLLFCKYKSQYVSKIILKNK